MKVMEVHFNKPHEMRYSTLGDYYEKDGLLRFDIADTGKIIYNKLTLVHEIVEQILTEAHGIKEEDILAFDLAHPNSPEPGLEEDSPYHKEHLIAESIEKILMAFCSDSWKNYNETLTKTIEEVDKNATR